LRAEIDESGALRPALVVLENAGAKGVETEAAETVFHATLVQIAKVTDKD